MPMKRPLDVYIPVLVIDPGAAPGADPGADPGAVEARYCPMLMLNVPSPAAS